MRALLAALLAVLGTGCARPDPPATILLVVVDTLRASSVAAWGNPRPVTPALDALAAEGTRYARAYSQAPWTTASIGSLLASQYPTSLGLRDLETRLPTGAPLLSEALRDAGYTTGAVVSHVLCGPDWGFDRGFDTFDAENAKGHDAVTSDDVTDRALAWLAAHPDGPRFLFVHYFDPHYAYIEHPELAPGDGAYRGPVRSGMRFAQLRRRAPVLGRRDVAELLRIYDSEVAFTDRAIGRLLDGLRRTGRWDDALVIVTADHGEEFLEHGDLGHVDTLHEELVHVPLLVKWPASRREPPRPGTAITAPVALIDLAPTVLALAGATPPDAWRGRSLLDREERLAERPVFTETSNRAELRAIVAGREKLILDLARDRVLLYDLAEDPAERRDLARERPAQRDALRARLERWLADHPAPERPESRALGPEEAERLRALGYATP